MRDMSGSLAARFHWITAQCLDDRTVASDGRC